MRIIPAIDIIEGKCVRLSEGDYSTKKVYNESPLEVALAFEDVGIEYLHLVDLDGATARRIVNWKVLELLKSKTNLTIDFGGGISDDREVEVAFNAGADQITGGSIAVKEKQTFLEWLQRYGADRIILGADAKDGDVKTHGWEEGSGMDVHDFIADYVKEGVRYCVCTDISKDGMLSGPSIELYKQLVAANGELSLIASGGISNVADVIKMKEIGMEGTIIGKAIYEQRISMDDLKQLIQDVK